MAYVYVCYVCGLCVNLCHGLVGPIFVDPRVESQIGSYFGSGVRSHVGHCIVGFHIQFKVGSLFRFNIGFYVWLHVGPNFGALGWI